MKPEIRTTEEMSPAQLADLRGVLHAAFGDEFTEADWQHTVWGHHVLITVDGAIAAHASVIERTLHAIGLAWRTGYVESVATRPEHQGSGMGRMVIRTASALIREQYQFGALSTGLWDFYESLGWERWQGLTYVRRNGRVHRTPEDDDGIMVLRFGDSAAIDLRSPISCEDRAGDVW